MDKEERRLGPRPQGYILSPYIGYRAKLWDSAASRELHPPLPTMRPRHAGRQGVVGDVWSRCKTRARREAAARMSGWSPAVTSNARLVDQAPTKTSLDSVHRERNRWRRAVVYDGISVVCISHELESRVVRRL